MGAGGALVTSERVHHRAGDPRREVNPEKSSKSGKVPVYRLTLHVAKGRRESDGALGQDTNQAL